MLVLQSEVEEYIGIPYAEPPIGKLRFKPPLPRQPWRGIYDATGPAVACPQPTFDNPGAKQLIQAEDCLHLHVWAPGKTVTTTLPVVVKIHGGGFSTGSSVESCSNGTFLAARTGYVVVSINYRLGILGLLNANSPEAPGNMGLLDQNLALRWVQENIQAFGGDPEMVTVVGSSSGAVSASAHILSPLSKGMFKRAILLSGSPYNIDFFDTVHESTRKGNEVSERLACIENKKDLISHPEEVLDCLRLKPVDELILAATEVAAPYPFLFFPTFHDEFMPRPPSIALDRGFVNEVDVMVGVSSDDGALEVFFSSAPECLSQTLEDVDDYIFERFLTDVATSAPKPVIHEMLEYYARHVPTGDRAAERRAFIDYVSDRLFNCPSQFFAEKYSALGNAVYAYVFGHKSSKTPTPKWIGVQHGTDFEYFFAHVLGNDDAYTLEDKSIGEDIVEMVASFAKYG